MKNSKFVYSTHNEHIPKEVDTVQNSTKRSDTAYIERDRKKRRGKVVTVISKLSGDLKALQKELQTLCGAGGSVKNECIEIQGDHRDKISERLKQKGYKVKFIGG